MADAVRTAIVLSMASLACFGVGLLGGLGASAAGAAAVAYERKGKSDVSQSVKQEAGIQATASVISATFYFVGMLAFFILLLNSSMRR